MTAQEFIKKWTNMWDLDGTPAVGIVINWKRIPLNSKVIQLLGRGAWNKIYQFSPPWDFGTNIRKPLRHWIDTKCPNYLQLIVDETNNGKMQFYQNNGLTYFDFCVFANTSDKGVLGDGNHRFLICDYLKSKGKDFSKDIERCRLEILYLENLEEVIESKIMPNY